MQMRLFEIGRHFLHSLEPEKAHNLTIRALKAGFFKHHRAKDDHRLKQRLWGLDFSNPVGMAAGFDKNGEVPDALFSLGFGFVEVGTVTPKPQPGNPRPRIFRLPEDGAVINRFGFNSEGHNALHHRLSKGHHYGILGVNIGANKDSKNRIEDYVEGVHAFADIADYLTINISSPNTPGLRDFQDPDQLNALLSWITAARQSSTRWCPLLVKLAPDFTEDEWQPVIDCLIANSVDGLIISNTTLSREGLTPNPVTEETGGLSGRPLFKRSTELLAKIYLYTKGQIPLIGVGGIDSSAAALAKISAGATLIQLYTGLIYRGPGLIPAIKNALSTDIEANGYSNIQEAVGRRAEAWAEGRVSWNPT